MEATQFNLKEVQFELEAKNSCLTVKASAEKVVKKKGCKKVSQILPSVYLPSNNCHTLAKISVDVECVTHLAKGLIYASPLSFMHCVT